MATLRAACVQMRSSDVVAENIAAAEALIREAAGGGAELVATPEMTSLLDRAPGATLKKSFAEADDPALAAFRALADELKVWLLIGSLPIKLAADRCANRSFLLDPGGAVAARYDKIHMFDAEIGANDVWRESALYQAGGRAVVADTSAARLGLSICYDVRFPQLYRALAQAGAEILTCPAAFTVPTGEAHWATLLRARAIEAGCFVLAPAQGGRHADGRDTYGHSMIIGPWGEVLAEADHDAPCVVAAGLDLDAVAAARARLPSLAHDRPFDPPAG